MDFMDTLMEKATFVKSFVLITNPLGVTSSAKFAVAMKNTFCAYAD